MGPDVLGCREATRTLGMPKTLRDETSTPRRQAIASRRNCNFADVGEHHDGSMMQWEPAEGYSLLRILSPPTMICVDNNGAMKLANNP